MEKLKLFVLLLAFCPLLNIHAEETDSQELRESASVQVDSLQLDSLTASLNSLTVEVPALETGQSYYNWKREVTYAGVPLFLSSFLIKGSKDNFHSTRESFAGNFSNHIDNYLQYSPYLLLFGMKLGGYQGRSNWGRFMVSAAFSNLVMAALNNGIKYTVKEVRPDHSSHKNSFPSGHTATVFVAATILHKEYGLTRSPWFSIGGYALATGTGVMRILNNRHWVHDVVAGAGIGIMSTELGYFLGDLLFKDKGIEREELEFSVNPEHPSFLDIHMGMGLHSNQIDFVSDEPNTGKESIRLGTSAVVGVEAAHFLNRNFGIGILGRITTTPVKGATTSDFIPADFNADTDSKTFNHASFDAGIYYNLPLGTRFSAGAKLMAGCRVSSGLSYKALNADGTESDRYLLRIKGKTAFNYVTGVNLTYRYRSNYSWKVFLDYDSARENYNYSRNYTTICTSGYARKTFGLFSLGGSFVVTL